MELYSQHSFVLTILVDLYNQELLLKPSRVQAKIPRYERKTEVGLDHDQSSKAKKIGADRGELLQTWTASWEQDGELTEPFIIFARVGMTEICELKQLEEKWATGHHKISRRLHTMPLHTFADVSSNAYDVAVHVRVKLKTLQKQIQGHLASSRG